MNYAACVKLNKNMDITNAIACPWCGENDRDMLEITDSGTSLRLRKNVWCPMCNVKGPEGINEESAVEQWNVRAGGQKPAMSKTQEPSTLASVTCSAADGERINWLEDNPMLIGITSDGQWQAAFQDGTNLGMGIQASSVRELLDKCRRQNL